MSWVIHFTCHEPALTVDPTVRLMAVTLSPGAVMIEWPTIIGALLLW